MLLLRPSRYWPTVAGWPLVCARVNGPCVPCVSRLPPVSFYRYSSVRRDPIEAYTADTSEQQLQYHA